MRPRVTDTSDVTATTPSFKTSWGLKIGGDSRKTNNGMCRGQFKCEEALNVLAQELNLIVLSKKYVKGDFDEDRSFMSNLEQAVHTNASMVIRRENLACRRQCVSFNQSCQYESLIFLHQLVRA